MPYIVTPTGLLGFQVIAAGLPEWGAGLIADFGSFAEAEAFVVTMRRIDAGRTHSMTLADPQWTVG
jgi:hypothetical protein